MNTPKDQTQAKETPQAPAEGPAPSGPSRVVAIAGRPNVGKSALFNRVAGRRIAIVHQESGVTRDRLVGDVSWYDEHFELIDTGGIGLMDGESTSDSIEQAAREQVDLAIADAASIILLTDISTGVLPLDQMVADLLRTSGKPVVVAANKADTAQHDDRAAEFEQLGFPVFPVSALHNRGMDELLEAALRPLPPPKPIEQVDPLRIAVVGRPNAGKSCYVNRLLNHQRVIVSSVPGTTRDSIEVPFTIGKGASAKRYVLIDTAGIRKFRQARDAVEKYSILRAEKSIEQADVVIMMLDATEGPKKQNKRIASLVLEHKKACIILVNKWDLAQGVTTQRQYSRALSEEWPFLGFVPVLYTSAHSGYNIKRTLDAVNYVADQVRTKLTTGLLNRVIRDAVAAQQPPFIKKHRLKIYYATQVGIQPITIRLFVNSTQRVTANYRSYLLGRLRAAFGLEGAPIVLQFKNRSSTSA